MSTQALETEQLPQGMCRPGLLRVASPTVKRACEHFPAAAAKLARANGLRPEEFDKLQQRCRSNPLYRCVGEVYVIEVHISRN